MLINLLSWFRLILRWLGKVKGCRALWNANQSDQISALLISYNATLPSDIHRKFRTLKNIAFFKATEFRSILLYAGIVLFKDFLPTCHYENFLKLCCAVIICSSKLYTPFLPLARTLFIEYIESHIDLYGIESIVSNLHNLSHIVDDVQYLGDLTTINAYPFENELYQMKLVLKQCNKPLQQLARRYHESDILRKPFSFETDCFPKVMSQFICLEAPNQMAFHQIEFKPRTVLCDNVKNKWFLLNTNAIAQFEFAFKTGTEYFIRGKQLKQTDNFFHRPFDSKYLNIFISTCECSESKNFNVKDVKAKMFSIPYGNKLVFIPLIHTL